jgi:hypothetical protein
MRRPATRPHSPTARATNVVSRRRVGGGKRSLHIQRPSLLRTRARLPVKDEACARGPVPGQCADRERANDAEESDDERAHYEQESGGK